MPTHPTALPLSIPALPGRTRHPCGYPYVKPDGDISIYSPDFVARRTGGEVWILETKGQEDLNDPGKWKRLQQWCADATRLEAGHSYRALSFEKKIGSGISRRASMTQSRYSPRKTS